MNPNKSAWEEAKLPLIAIAVSGSLLGLMKSCEAWEESRAETAAAAQKLAELDFRTTVCRPAIASVFVSAKSKGFDHQPPGYRYWQENDDLMRPSLEDRQYTRYRAIADANEALEKGGEGLLKNASVSALCGELRTQHEIKLVDPDSELRQYPPEMAAQRAADRRDKAIADGNQAQLSVLERWAKKSDSHEIDVTGPSRIDTFHLKAGGVVMCRTSVVRGLTAVSCRNIY